MSIQYQKLMEASANTSQPLIGAQDVLLIFSCVPELRRIHRAFLRLLRERIAPAANRLINDTPIADAYALFVCSPLRLHTGPNLFKHKPKSNTVPQPNQIV